MLRYLTAGESHGAALVVIVEGLPAGLPIQVEEVQGELARRRLGYGRGPRMRFEQDEVTLVGGVRHGRTLGSPVAIEIANTEWTRSDKWHEEMSPAPGATKDPATQPRPGHADLAGMQKYGFDDARDVLERASARETAARVAAGTLAKALLSHLGISVLSHVIQMGQARSTAGVRPTPADLGAVDEDEVRCFDGDASAAMVEEIKAAAKDGDSLGGVAEVLAYGVPVGLGSHVHWDRKIDAALAQALMSIQAVKGVEIGDGFEVAGLRGSDAHDPIGWASEARDGRGDYVRDGTRAGGVEGGITTGELLVARAAMKPLASLNRPTLKTVDVRTKEETVSFKERTDVTAVPAMGVVAETMVALVLATEAMRKFGGDSLDELVRNHDGYAQPGEPVVITVEVPVPGRSYPAVVGHGARSELASLLPERTGRVAVVTQRGIGMTADPGVEHRVFHIESGEDAKTLRTVEWLCRQWATWGLTRADCVVAIGGGMVTDVAGFAAASYHRGVPVVHVATTLLGMVDAAIGGKTGVNLPEGKNLVGAFWQPVAVVCDLEALDTLPPRELRGGYGELAKYRFLPGGEDLDALELEEQVARCIRIKADIVAADEREGGLRAILNYGHTLAHAIETAGEYDLRHGEAVAVGLLYAAALARRLGRITDERVALHQEIVGRYDLPDRIPDGLEDDQLLSLMGRDKKALDGLTFVLDGDRGVEIVTGVDPEVARAASGDVR